MYLYSSGIITATLHWHCLGTEHCLHGFWVPKPQSLLLRPLVSGIQVPQSCVLALDPAPHLGTTDAEVSGFQSQRVYLCSLLFLGHGFQSSKGLLSNIYLTPNISFTSSPNCLFNCILSLFFGVKINKNFNLLKGNFPIFYSFSTHLF